VKDFKEIIELVNTFSEYVPKDIWESLDLDQKRELIEAIKKVIKDPKLRICTQI
jgi:hypothetical protein